MGLAEDAAVAGKALNNSITKRTKNKQLPPQFEASPCRARASRGKPKMLACFGRPEQDEGSGEWEGGTPNSVEFGVPPSHSDECPNHAADAVLLGEAKNVLRRASSLPEDLRDASRSRLR